MITTTTFQLLFCLPFLFSPEIIINLDYILLYTTTAARQIFLASCL